jgi:hypothetical protein
MVEGDHSGAAALGEGEAPVVHLPPPRLDATRRGLATTRSTLKKVVN